MKESSRCWYFMHDIDLFGKEVELYYNGKSKLTSWFGVFFTILYISAYLAFFIYKVIRMMKRDDVTFMIVMILKGSRQI